MNKSIVWEALEEIHIANAVDIKPTHWWNKFLSELPEEKKTAASLLWEAYLAEEISCGKLMRGAVELFEPEGPTMMAFKLIEASQVSFDRMITGIETWLSGVEKVVNSASQRK